MGRREVRQEIDEGIPALRFTTPTVGAIRSKSRRIINRLPGPEYVFRLDFPSSSLEFSPLFLARVLNNSYPSSEHFSALDSSVFSLRLARAGHEDSVILGEDNFVRR